MSWPGAAWYRNAGLRVKLALHVVIATTLLVAILLPVIIQLQKRSMLRAVQDSGFDVVEMLARSTVQAIAADDYVLMQLIVDGVASDGKVLSAMLMKSNGEIIVHSQPAERGTRYADVRSVAAASAQGRLLQEYEGAEGTAVYDFAVPVYMLGEKQATARLVMSIERELDVIARVRDAVLLAGLLILGISLLWATHQARGLIRPVKELVQGTAEITKGNLDHRIPVTSGDEMGQLAAAFNTMTDDLTRAQADLVRKTRLAAIGEIAAAVAHETRNPLGALSNCVQLLRHTDGLSAESVELLAMIRVEADRLNRIVTDFLRFGHPRPPQLEPFALHELIDDTLALLEHDRAGAPLEICRRFDSSIAKIDVDHDQLHQALWNIFVNSAQAMGDGGTLTIETRRVPAGVEIAVRDTGRGIPPEALRDIFEPFYTRRAGGTGLGLAIVRRIVDDHRGQIDVESVVGHGTCFRITLPAHG